MSSPISSRTSVTHTCPGGCGLDVQSNHFACRTCWFRLPFDLRKPITANYRRDPAAHFAAMSAAMAWYADNPVLQASSNHDQDLELPLSDEDRDAVRLELARVAAFAREHTGHEVVGFIRDRIAKLREASNG